MKRLHLFEFEDFSWFPNSWRDLVTDYLHFMVNKFHFYEPIIPLLRNTLVQINCQRIIDLGSGGSGPWPKLRDRLTEKSVSSLEIILTDKFPSETASGRTSKYEGVNIKYYPHSIDACDVPENLSGFRTMFNSFHHFKPGQALKILEDAVRKKDGIGIFELTGRDLVMLIYVLLSPIAVLLFTPFIKPYKWKRILFTYLLPVVPIIAVWDGMISNFRTYSVTELKSLNQKVKDLEYKWKIGQMRNKYGIQVTYFIGFPEPKTDQ